MPVISSFFPSCFALTVEPVLGSGREHKEVKNPSFPARAPGEGPWELEHMENAGERDPGVHSVYESQAHL